MMVRVFSSLLLDPAKKLGGGGGRRQKLMGETKGERVPRMAVNFGPTKSRMGPITTGPKLRAKMPMFHKTASLLSCVAHWVARP